MPPTMMFCEIAQLRSPTQKNAREMPQQLHGESFADRLRGVIGLEYPVEVADGKRERIWELFRGS